MGSNFDLRVLERKICPRSEIDGRGDGRRAREDRPHSLPVPILLRSWSYPKHILFRLSHRS